MLKKDEKDKILLFRFFPLFILVTRRTIDV